MTTAGTMHVVRFMALVPELLRAAIGVLGADLDHMLLDDIAILIVQVTVVKIIDVIAMTDCGVAATRTVPMRMIEKALCHDRFLSFLVTLWVGDFFAGVLDGIVDDVQNVGISEGIDGRLPDPPSVQQASCQQDFQAGRRRRDLFFFKLGEEADTHLGMSKAQHHS